MLLFGSGSGSGDGELAAAIDCARETTAKINDFIVRIPKSILNYVRTLRKRTATAVGIL